VPAARRGSVVAGRSIRGLQPGRRQAFTRPSHLSGRYTQGYHRTAYDRVSRFRAGHGSIYSSVYARGQHWSQLRSSWLHSRGSYCSGFYGSPYYHGYYEDYYSYGFYGGYYYPVRPCYDIGIYFTYPMVSWFYTSYPDDSFYSSYPDVDYASYPVEPFPYYDTYYPTDTMRDIGVEASGYSAQEQAGFREAFVRMTQLLQEQISASLQATYTFAQGDIVINHYQNLSGQALLVEGFVTHDDLHVAFKAVLDLVNPVEGTLVFVPSNATPTEEDLAALKTINDRIIALGGDPMTAIDEPTAVQQ
jgi:hypothetical protein